MGRRELTGKRRFRCQTPVDRYDNGTEKRNFVLKLGRSRLEPNPAAV